MVRGLPGGIGDHDLARSEPVAVGLNVIRMLQVATDPPIPRSRYSSEIPPVSTTLFRYTVRALVVVTGYRAGWHPHHLLIEYHVGLGKRD